MVHEWGPRCGSHRINFATDMVEITNMHNNGGRPSRLRISSIWIDQHGRRYKSRKRSKEKQDAKKSRSRK